MIERVEIPVGSRPAKVRLGAQAERLPSLPGGWHAAELHWAPVWERLTARFRVVAPELPGVGDPATPGLPSFDAYADWAASLLAALDVERVTCVGNSFGGAVAWQLAARL